MTRPSLPWWKDAESRALLIAEMAASGHWTMREVGQIWGISREAVRLLLNSRAPCIVETNPVDVIFARRAMRKQFLEAAE